MCVRGLDWLDVCKISGDHSDSIVATVLALKANPGIPYGPQYTVRSNS